MKKAATALVLVLMISFIYRIVALNAAVPFWVDEFATADQAKLVLKHGFNIFFQNIDAFEHHNVTTHFLVAAFIKYFGETVQSVRLPFVILGTLVPGLVFILSKKFSGNNLTALAAGLLTALSYWQITWSLQARSYVLQQVIILLTLIVYLDFVRNKNKTNLFFLCLLTIIGILTHTTYLLVTMSLVLSFLLFNLKQIIKFLKTPIFYLFLLMVFAVGWKTQTLFSIISNLENIFKNGLVNNVWYYHSFLWREYTLVTFLGGIGLILMWMKNKAQAAPLWFTLIFFLIFVCFLFPPYVSRYLLVIFPILLIGVAVSLEQIGLLISKKYKFIGLILTLFIILNGDKFVIKPKAYYSVNHDLREIANIDYNQVYQIVLSKVKEYPNQVAVIDPWVPRSSWYLKTDCSNCYWFRWIKEEGVVNGMVKQTNFLVNEKHEKYMARSGNPPIRFIGELSDLKLAMSKYKYGLIWIDDASLPAAIIKFARENFHEEIYLDHYPLDTNPFSIWPGTLYSWGFETPNPFYPTSQTEIKTP